MSEYDIIVHEVVALTPPRVCLEGSASPICYDGKYVDAILEMKNQRDKLHQYQKRITKLTDRETAIARECLARGQKSKALLALRRKKYQESLLAKTDLQLEQLQQLTSDIEFASVQKDVLFGLQQGTKVLNQIHAEMGGIDNVEKLLGESAEARAYEREISQMLGGKMSNAEEDEVEDELEALEKEVNGIKTPEVPILPSAPSAELKDPEAEEAARKLKARMRAQARVKTNEETGRQAAEPMLA
ncbi:Vacuolar protein sorting-associated protein 20 [Trapelia coarctata]|nr:Vacuolar protein sorting-associated protein 20 [Trapelia coarctata]